MNFKGLFKTMNIEKPEYCTGSGIIIYLDNRESIFTDLESDILYLFLGCNGEINKKYENMLDFPKGAIDKGEFSLDCAIRETEEEIGFTEEDYNILEDENNNTYRLECGRGLIMYIAEIKKDHIGRARLKKNPKTNILEHSSYHWSVYQENIVNLPNYLQNSLDWAHNILTNK
jgi:8-oxo-dGTP pyrophosphatase MutT (NUDIX family)